MRAFNIAASGILALCALAPARAALGQSVSQECRAVFAQDAVPAAFTPAWTIGSPKAIYDAILPRLARDEWFAVADSLHADFAADSTSLPDTVRAVMLANLDALRREFAAVSGVRMSQARATGTGPEQGRFDDDALGGRVFLFNNKVIIDSSWSVVQRRALCGRTIAIRRMLFAWGQMGRENATAALQKSVTRWDNYSTRGYFQFPWELAINSIGFDAASDDPPRSQWVIAHPAFGLEFIASRVESWDNFQPLETLTIEFGWLRYNTSRSFYTGLTLFGSIPGDEAMGFGAMLHLGPKFKVGYVTRSDDPAGESRNGIVVSTDLAQIIAKTPATLQSMRDLISRRLEAKKGAILRAIRIAP
jgi:hypothetical protein